jgi:predicted TIM-barrel fold metal-dependent hydrolase
MHFDPFWKRVEETGMITLFHIGNTPFNELYAAEWGEPANPPSHRFTALNTFMGMGERTIVDQVAALIYHDLFGRFPGLKMMIVEFGASWVPHLLKVLDKIYALGDHKTRWRYSKPARPSEVFKKHFKVVPFHEDDFPRLAHCIGADAIINGSDYPHPEGLIWPVEMEEEMSEFSPEDVRKMMRSNAAGWLGLKD